MKAVFVQNRRKRGRAYFHFWTPWKGGSKNGPKTEKWPIFRNSQKMDFFCTFFGPLKKGRFSIKIVCPKRAVVEKAEKPRKSGFLTLKSTFSPVSEHYLGWNATNLKKGSEKKLKKRCSKWKVSLFGTQKVHFAHGGSRMAQIPLGGEKTCFGGGAQNDPFLRPPILNFGEKWPLFLTFPRRALTKKLKKYVNNVSKWPRDLFPGTGKKSKKPKKRVFSPKKNNFGGCVSSKKSSHLIRQWN